MPAVRHHCMEDALVYFIVNPNIQKHIHTLCIVLLLRHGWMHFDNLKEQSYISAVTITTDNGIAMSWGPAGDDISVNQTEYKS